MRDDSIKGEVYVVKQEESRVTVRVHGKKDSKSLLAVGVYMDNHLVKVYTKTVELKANEETDVTFEMPLDGEIKVFLRDL